jgi:ubiquinone/menaquinone biosynthesis C-methylase UbiE
MSQQFSNLPGLAAYERYYTTRIFEPWAKVLLGRLKLAAGERLLDVATGPGTVARLAAVRMGSHGRVVGTDLSPEMLSIARAKLSAPGAPIE